jgi:hypothetical protein
MNSYKTEHNKPVYIVGHVGWSPNYGHNNPQKIHVPSRLNDILSNIRYRYNREELKNFILALDLSIAEEDFTRSLIRSLIDSLLDDNPEETAESIVSDIYENES